MNQELVAIILTMSKHKGFKKFYLCMAVIRKVIKTKDECTHRRCNVCPLGVSHVSSGYLREVLSLRII